MTTKLSTATQNAMCDAAVDRIDVGGAGTVKIYDGTQAADANTAVGAQVLLATFTLNATAFGSASSGVATLAGVPITTTGLAAGTATWFRVESGAGTPLKVFDGQVTATGGGGQLQLNTTTVSVGVNLEITTGTFTMPAN